MSSGHVQSAASVLLVLEVSVGQSFLCFVSPESVPVVTTSHFHHGAFLHGNQRPRERELHLFTIFLFRSASFIYCLSFMSKLIIESDRFKTFSDI